MRTMSRRVVVFSLVASAALAAVAGPASARPPRSWLVPPLEVSCTAGDSGKTEAFRGDFVLTRFVADKGQLLVGGNVFGTCGAASVDSAFRTTVTIVTASCAGAELELGDIRVTDARIALSEQHVVIAPDTKKIRSALCAVGGASRGSPKAQAQTLNNLLALVGG